MKNLDEVEVLVITQNYWGRAKTLDAALQLAYNPKKYQVFICHANTRVDDMGYVSYPKNFVPREILRKGLGRSKGFASFEQQASPDEQNKKDFENRLCHD